MLGEPADLALFTKQLAKAKGGPGLDQWASLELRYLARVVPACAFVWDEMQLWMESGITPSIIKQVKVSFVPKANKVQDGCIKPDCLRPITVFSAWWRSFSATWVQCDLVKNLQAILPHNMMSGFGGHGPEVQAATIDSIFHEFGCAATLDYKLCFDTVNVELIEKSLCVALPPALVPWAKCICQQWRNRQKWIVYNKHPHSTPFISVTGIPQGDPASPLFLGLLLWYGYYKVQNCEYQGRVYQGLYMDDRTVVTECTADLEIAVNAWNQFSLDFHLLENMSKLQQADLDKECKTLEVLGAVIGKPAKWGFGTYPKHQQRIEKAKKWMRRVALLPFGWKGRLRDIAVFCKSAMVYGWISGLPTKERRSAYNILIWKVLGHFRFAPVPLRSLVGSCHIDFEKANLLRQLHVLAHRNKELLKYNLGCRTNLDQMVHDGLEEFGRFLDQDNAWQHQYFDFKFNEHEVTNKQKWKKISHEIRMSMRYKEYQALAASERHEIAGCELPEFCSSRFQLMRKWIKGDKHIDGRRIAFAIGSVQSPYNAAENHYKPGTECHVCGTKQPHWDHIWTCCLNMQIPSDQLLRRFLWPRSFADFPLCEMFMQEFGKIRPSK